MYPYNRLIQIFPDPTMRRFRILPRNMPPPQVAPATVLYSQIFPPPRNWLGAGTRNTMESGNKIETMCPTKKSTWQPRWQKNDRVSWQEGPWIVTVTRIFMFEHFFQGYFMDRRIGFIEEGPSGQCTTWSTQVSRMQLHAAYSRIARNKGKHTDYSPSLHLSPRARSALKRPATFHNAGFDRMLWTTMEDDGVAPSKTISFQCLQRHQHTKATLAQKSRTSTALPRQDYNQSASEIPCEGSRSSLSHQRR
jgi:hypothetical protein